MDADLQKRFDEELARHEQVILALANERLQRFVKEWGTTPMKLSFGMGSCYVEVDGVQAYDDDYEEIELVLRDVLAVRTRGI